MLYLKEELDNVGFMQRCWFIAYDILSSLSGRTIEKQESVLDTEVYSQ